MLEVKVQLNYHQFRRSIPNQSIARQDVSKFIQFPWQRKDNTHLNTCIWQSNMASPHMIVKYDYHHQKGLNQRVSYLEGLVKLPASRSIHFHKSELCPSSGSHFTGPNNIHKPVDTHVFTNYIHLCPLYVVWPSSKSMTL